ncbi:M16 family metallopeptidase [Alkaliphilus peptidifermentans]|uniref:Predicted Zn-dependent peptidase n=1 Tax=Alkaliphilus peptidifermentans DSM 18978 TaxID=1120976 RepID=A0A1G5DBQ8_9FIRM|nr:pitrilysin family protein [Alkaliphilus peptidifermentans]SCY12152.1 Predicted Zn-dependent peptidase [Alkaliphilus peptidifermentans DSM 18978]
MYKKYTLDNGLRIVSEHIPYVKSISIGVWVETGSKNEDNSNNGVSHFIEHMLFKGTATRTAMDIADIVDGVGGQINAFTGKECTCYYIKVLDSHYDLAIDLLSDMLFNSKLDPIDIDKERSVIMEEISMYEDSPEDLVHDLLSQTVFKDSSLGLPILGTADTLSTINKDVLNNFMNDYYVPEKTVISIAGNFKEEEILKTIEKKFGGWNRKTNGKEKIDLNYSFKKVHRTKDVEQAHLCMAFKGISLGHEDIYPLMVVNNILGGSMSSRLFQTIREERGLAYSIYSYPSFYKEGGLLTIYGGMNPQQLEEVTSLVYQELQNVKVKGLTDGELLKSKEQLKGNYILGLESTSSRMTSIGKSELLLGKINSPKEIIEKIDAIKMEHIIDVIKRVIQLDSVAVATLSKQNQGDVIEKVFNNNNN